MRKKREGNKERTMKDLEAGFETREGSPRALGPSGTCRVHDLKWFLIQ